METFFIYFLKVNGLILTFFLAYYFLLRKETFFNKNRWFLILGLVASLLLPLIKFTKILWIEPIPVVYKTSFIEKSPTILTDQVVETPFDWSVFFVFVYGLLVLFFLTKMLVELFSFFRIIKVGSRLKLNETILIDSPYNTNPFSFFNYIVFNSKLFSQEELKHIISHENIHVKEKHSIDVLLGKLFCALFWINPISWFYNKEMLQNLEYIADNKASSIAQNRINYQKTLLKVVTNQHQLSITNQFYQSLIKKRIVMLNTNQSNQKKSWKYVLILPVLSVFMLLFQVETVAQIKENSSNLASSQFSKNQSSILTKNTTKQELVELEKSFSGQNQKLKISNVKRNKNGEIVEIKLLFDTGKTYHRVMERISKEPIDPIEIFIKIDIEGNKDCGFEEIDLHAIYAEEIIEVEDIPKYKYISLDNLTKNGKDIILIINGKIKGKAEEFQISFDEEIGEMKEISAAEFKKRYYQEADKSKIYYEVETVKLKAVVGSWDETYKVMEDKKSVNQLFIINGKEYMQNDLPKGILMKSERMTKPSIEEGVKKYGQKAKDGVLIFEGKTSFTKNGKPLVFGKYVEKSIPSDETNTYNYTVSSQFSETAEHNQIENVKKNEHVDYKKALLIYDGKEINKEDLDKIEGSIIASSAMLGPTYGEKKYGEKGKNGVIEIKSQNYLEETDPFYKEIVNQYKSKNETELNAKQNSNLADDEIADRLNKRKKVIEERKKVLEKRKSERKIEYEKRKTSLEEKDEKLK